MGLKGCFVVLLRSKLEQPLGHSSLGLAFVQFKEGGSMGPVCQNVPTFPCRYINRREAMKKP